MNSTQSCHTYAPDTPLKQIAPSLSLSPSTSFTIGTKREKTRAGDAKYGKWCHYDKFASFTDVFVAKVVYWWTLAATLLYECCAVAEFADFTVAMRRSALQQQQQRQPHQQTPCTQAHREHPFTHTHTHSLATHTQHDENKKQQCRTFSRVLLLFVDGLRTSVAGDFLEFSHCFVFAERARNLMRRDSRSDDTPATGGDTTTLSKHLKASLARVPLCV